MSVAVNYVTGLCNINILRLLNLTLMMPLAKQFFDLLGMVSRTIGPASTGNQESRQAYFAHTALNLCLFPPLVFFSALYYTDLAAVVVVLYAIKACLVQSQRPSPGWGLALVQICMGLWALLFRQTNVFWVGLFPIGVTVLRLSMDGQAKQKASSSKDAKGQPAIEGKLAVLVDQG